MSEPICPQCAEAMDPAEALWLVNEKYLCSEDCARRAAGAVNREGGVHWPPHRG